MGLLNLFECDDCGYAAEVSGGRDYGGISHVQTMACDHCREIVDVVVATDWPDDEERRERVGRCPRCGAAEGLVPWGEGSQFPVQGSFDQHPVWGTCPKCGGTVRFAASIGIWDG